MSFDVKRIPLIWIPMRDGVKLAAKIWLPEPGNGADNNASCKDSKYPAILEFLPYRRTDWTAQRDERHFFYFCSHGYGCVRVDMRGSGDSEGFFFDEYVPQEQQDCCDVISWISCQNWCTGNVGMFGKSWGGFNGLQLAALQVQELKTVISTYSSDDRYDDDVHYRGGCVLGSAMLSWAHRMFLWNARPPHPQSLGTRWKDVWLERLQKSSEPWIHKWLSHQTRDSYWKHGSICEDYDSIKCPVLLIGGFCDLYTDPVFRMVEHLTCPVKALIGPWPHEWPAIAKPGPQIDHMKECLRWWDCHLKGLSTGIMEEPNIRVYLRDGISQAIKEEVWPGKWIAEDRWPSSNVQQQEYTLQGSGGLALASEDQKHHVPGVQSNSTSVSAVRVKSSFLSGLWGGVPLVFELDELPVDQRFEDVLTACWETPTLQTSAALFGFPEVHLLLSSDKPGALIAARLCDVFPDGESALITKGVLNLTHRKGHSSDTIHPLQPHEIFQIQFKLDSTAYTVSAGHKIRLALSSMYWPLVWPSPQVSCLSIQTGSQSKLLLPVRLPSKEAKERDAQLKEFDSRPQNRNALPVEWHREPRKTRKLEIDQLADVYTLTITNDSGCVLLKDTSTVYDESNTEVYTIEESTPASAKVTIHGQVTLREEKTAEQDDRVEVWDTEVQASSEMWADEEFFHLRSSLKAWHCTDVCFEKTWTKKIDRFFV